jgi:3-hydroxyisobutyrate dehydrogenase
MRNQNDKPIVGFLGIGAMGLPMALRMHQDSQHIRAVDLNPAQVKKARSAGLAATTDPADLAGAASLFVIVATGSQLMGLLEGELLGASSTVETVVVLSTVGVDVVRHFASQLKKRGISVVDCPVTGGVSGAIEGTLSLFAAGDPEDISAVRRSLDAVGNVKDCGRKIGDGQAFKMVNQHLAASHLAVAGEALALAKALGLEPAAALQLVGAGAGASWMLNDRGPRMVQDAARRPVQTQLSIFVKDAGLVSAAALSAGFDARIMRVVAQQFQQAVSEGLENADDSAITDINRVLPDVIHGNP